MAEDHWLPPRAPMHPPEGALPRAPGAMPRRPRAPSPTRPSELAALALGSSSVLVTVFSLGAAFVYAGVFALAGLFLGRRTGRRAAAVLGWAGLGLAFVAGVTWMILASKGITPPDLQGSLRHASTH